MVLFIIGVFVFNFKSYQKLNFYNEKFLKEKDSLNREIYLLKEVAINLEKFRLFFEPIYLEEIKRLTRESNILGDSLENFFITNLSYFTLVNKIRKDDLIVFANFRELLKKKEAILQEKLNKSESNYLVFKRQKIQELYFLNKITFLGLIVLMILVNIFLPFKRKKDKVVNNYISLLELLKIVNEKIDQYLEKINTWKNKLKELQKPLDIKNLENVQVFDNYKKIFTYYLLNLRLGLFHNDQSLIDKYSTNLKEMSERIINLFSLNEQENLINYLKEKEEELNLFKEELVNLKKIIGEVKNYEIKK